MAIIANVTGGTRRQNECCPMFPSVPEKANRPDRVIQKFYEMNHAPRVLKSTIKVIPSPAPARGGPFNMPDHATIRLPGRVERKIKRRLRVSTAKPASHPVVCDHDRAQCARRGGRGGPE